MIFKWANVTLHEEFLLLIPSDIEHADFLTTITKECGLLFNQHEENKTELHGSWQNILKAEKVLQNYLIEWEAIKRNITHDLPEGIKINDKVKDGAGLQHVVVSNKETENNFQDELSDFMGEYVINCKTNDDSNKRTFIGKIKDNLQLNDINCKEKGDIETNGKGKEMEELYMNITVASKEIPTNQSSTFCWEDSDRSESENPLDKLCQLLQINEEEEKDRRLWEANKKKKYEASLPFKHFCSQCSFKTRRESHYLKHTQLHNKIEKLFSCEHCEFKTIRLSTLRKHEMIHCSQRLLTCDMCPYKTDKAKLLIKHLQTKHVHKCSHCEFIARTVKEVRKHFHITHKLRKIPTLWKCEKCPYKSRLRAHLQRHINDVHSSLRSFLCHYCGKCFKRHDTLKQHKVIHGEINPSYTCAQCNKICSSASQLKQHMSVHTALRPFLCEHCGASFKTKSIQRKHVKTLHSTQMPLQCSMCTRSFKGKASLIRHLESHRKEPQDKVVQLAIPEIAICENATQDNIPVVLEINNTPLKIEVLYSNIGDLCKGAKQFSKMTVAGPVETALRKKLSEQLKPVHLEVINESHMHNAPKEDERHFKVIVVSDLFKNKSIIQQHQMIHSVLAEELKNAVHAISIVTKTPEQWSENSEVSPSPACRGGFGK